MNITAYLYVPFAAWVIAQIIKFSLALVRGEGDIRYLYASGGMPSVHSAVVCSLATWALIEGGVASPLFGVTAVFAAIVMYDSFGVRRSSGEQARTLNRLIGDLAVTGGIKNVQDYNELREILGHKPLEVLVGAALGIFIAAGFGFQKISDTFPSIFTTPEAMHAKVLMIIGAVLVVSIAPIYYIAVKKFKKNDKAKTALTSLGLSNVVAGLLLAASGLLAYERVYSSFAEWYIIGIIVILWAIAIAAFLVVFLKNMNSTKPTTDQERKSQWLQRAGKKKK